MGIEGAVSAEVKVFQKRFGFLRGKELKSDQLTLMSVADLANSKIYVDGRPVIIAAPSRLIFTSDGSVREIYDSLVSFLGLVVLLGRGRMILLLIKSQLWSI